jgi:hypothetical protein
VVLVLVRPDDQAGLAELETALGAHLSSFDVEVRRQGATQLSAPPGRQAEEVRDLVQEHRALAAVWTDPSGSIVFVMLARDGADEQILVRFLPDSGSAGELEAVASMIRSALLPLVTAPQEPLSPESSPESLKGASEADVIWQETDDELPPLAVLEVVEPPPPPEPWLTIYGRGGYAPLLSSGAEPLVQGSRLGVGAFMFEHLELELATDLVAPVQGERPHEDISLKRWPLRVSLGGYITLPGEVDLSLRLGGLLDFIRVDGLESESTEGDTSYLAAGFAGSGVIRYRMVPWLAFWVEGGVDVFRTGFTFTRNNRQDTVFRFSAVQGQLFVGVALLFEVV